MAKSASANISIRMDTELKAAAEELFADLGMNISTAFNIFVRQALREGRFLEKHRMLRLWLHLLKQIK